MNKNSQEFLKIFKKIENYLRKKMHATPEMSFASLIKKVAAEDPLIKIYESYLQKCNQIRNRLAHDPEEESVCEATSKAVKKLKIIYRQFLRPQTAYQISSKPVFRCQINDSLFETIKIMEKKIFTHVPIYTNDKKFVGVLSENSIFNWLADSTDTNLALENTKVGDINKYLDIENRPTEYFKFVSPNTSAYKIKEWFTKAIAENKRLGAVFVTKNGKKNGKLIGIITAWDLPRIKII